MTVVASKFDRKENDLYETEAWATLAVLKHMPPLNGWKVWEPAAGNHAMAKVIRETGARVYTSDIVTYDVEHNAIFDFLDEDKPSPLGFHALITNPPYGKSNRDAVRFAELALQRCKGYVALLFTAKFDFGKTRVHLFRDNPRFMAKVALIDRISWFNTGMSGTEDHCWMIWGPEGMPPHIPTLLYEGKP